MKKVKFFSGIAALAIAIIITLNVNFGIKCNNLPDTLLANIEALAGGGDDDDDVKCIGDKFKIVPVDGGWRCENDKGNSCCPLI